MDKKTLIRSLIEYYRVLIQNLDTLNFMDARDMVRYRSANFGICYTTYALFGQIIQDQEWVQQYKCPQNWYWGPIPSEAETKEELIECLQIRLDILLKEQEAMKIDAEASVEKLLTAVRDLRAEYIKREGNWFNKFMRFLRLKR